jgi:hypothetical protein
MSATRIDPCQECVAVALALRVVRDLDSGRGTAPGEGSKCDRLVNDALR